MSNHDLQKLMNQLDETIQPFKLPDIISNLDFKTSPTAEQILEELIELVMDESFDGFLNVDIPLKEKDSSISTLIKRFLSSILKENGYLLKISYLPFSKYTESASHRHYTSQLINLNDNSRWLMNIVIIPDISAWVKLK